MSAIDINGGIAIAQIVVVSVLAGTVLERLKSVKERQAEDRTKFAGDLREEREAREKAVERLRSDSSVQIAEGDRTRDTRIERLEKRIDELDTDLSGRLESAVEKIGGVVSGIVNKLNEVASHVSRLDGKLSQPRMGAVKDPRRDD